MAHTITVTGTAPRDHFAASATISEEPGGWWISKDRAKFWVEAAEPPHGGGKFIARFPPEVLDLADYVRFGGGGYNSILEMNAIAPEVQLTYWDSGQHDVGLESDLRSRGIAYNWRGLHPVQNNVVVANPLTSDKIVFKPKLAHFATDGSVVSVSIQEGSDVVLVNSDKDRERVIALAGLAARDQVRMNFVITPALHPEILWGAVCPYANLLIGSWDEVGTAMGSAVPVTIDGAMQTVRALAGQWQAPGVHITMGEHGVLVADHEGDAVLHVRLKRGKSKDVQRALIDPSRVCGCGDCYAGVVTLHLVTGHSLFGTGPLHDSAQASAAIAGCASAVRRLGYERRLDPDDFEVSSVGKLDGGAGLDVRAA